MGRKAWETGWHFSHAEREGAVAAVAGRHWVRDLGGCVFSLADWLNRMTT